MNRLWVFLAVFWIAAAQSASFAAETADKILAVVNRHVITQVDINNYLEGLRFRLARQFKGDELDRAYREEAKNALSDLIGDILIVEEAEKEKINIPAEMVEARFEKFRKSFSSAAEFDAYLKRTGISISDIKRKIKRQLLIREFINRKIRPFIEIKPSEITSYYRTHQEQFRYPKEVEYESLKFDSASAAEEALNKIKREGFAKARAAYADQLFSGSINIKQCRPELLPLFSLKAEECSGVIKVDDSYFIFCVKKVSPERMAALKDVQSKIWSIIYQDKFSRRLEQLVEGLKKKAVIKIYEKEKTGN